MCTSTPKPPQPKPPAPPPPPPPVLDQGAPTEATSADENRKKRTKAKQAGGTKPYRTGSLSIGGGSGSAGSSSGGVGV